MQTKRRRWKNERVGFEAAEVVRVIGDMTDDGVFLFVCVCSVFSVQCSVFSIQYSNQIIIFITNCCVFVCFSWVSPWVESQEVFT
jgi:hypothetical protein